MTRVLLFGFGPLPGEGGTSLAPATRTRHFVRVLLDAGHDVCLFATRMGASGSSDAEEPTTVIDSHLTWHRLPMGTSLSLLRRVAAEWSGECAIGVCMAGASLAAQVVGDLPLWADLYGSALAEAQLKADVYGDDGFLRYFVLDELQAVQRADAFSCVSDRQRWSLIGELGLSGRLNRWTAGYDFATVIPPASETSPYIFERRVIRGSVVHDDAFVVLHTGGYNTWYDVDGLFHALERVMAARPEVQFVSTGGPLEGHDELTYERFERLVADSAYRERFHLRGWVPAADLPGYYLESNVGVIADRPSYEASLGSRTRVLDWMRAGLPCVLSDLPELARDVAAAGAGLNYRAGDVENLADCLLRCAADRDATAEMGRRARELLLARYSYAATSESLLRWVAEPQHAPDYGKVYPHFVRGPSRRLLAARASIGRQVLKVKGARTAWHGIKRAAWRASAAVTRS
jgi:glycosyltransferase involved in cell wall biosynthesis